MFLLGKHNEHIRRPQFDNRAQQLYENAHKQMILITQLLQPTTSCFKVIIEGNPRVGKTSLGLQAGYGTQTSSQPDEYICTAFDP